MSDGYSSNDHSYSGDTMSTWYWTDAGRERAQMDAIEQQRAHTRRLERERRAGEAKLAEKISTAASEMHSRLDTVLRWTELRFQLLEFDEYQARKEIRNTVRALAAGRMPVLRGIDDVPGYWLPPAAAAVLPLVVRDRFPGQGTGGNAFADLKTGLEAARERDAVRAELFGLAVGRCFDQPVFTDAAVLRLLSEPADLGVVEPGQVARGWRTLWEQAALGAFGPGAEAQLASLLRERFDPGALDEAALAAWDEAIGGFGGSRPASLAALAAHFTAVAGPEERAGEANVDGATVGDAAPGTAAGDGTGSGALRLGEPGRAAADIAGTAALLDVDGASGGGTGTARLGDAAREDAAAEPRYDDAVWRSYLQELIEEPSEGELPLVREMAGLHPSAEGREGARHSWTDPAGTVADLVRRDLFDPEAPMPLRRLALGLAAPVLRERLDRIEASLGTPAKATVTVRRRGEYIEVTRDGHDPDQFAAVERRIERAFAAAAPSKPVATAIGAALALLGVLMVAFGQWFLAVLFVLAVIIPIAKYRSDAAKARTNQHRRDEQLAETRAALAKARKDAENQERAETENGLAARRALEQLRETLPAGTTPNALSGPGPNALTA
ncbi:hypothetical protein [Glycomyces sp. NPDC021274]|uniref:hypothetical protein n=1 Tax=Glycomyces sp. NPDC021274 TaxID=3155120 RepID=UPI003405376B